MSLRAMMVAVLLVGAGLGWLARRAHLQRRGVATIIARGGRVTYDWAISDPKTGRKALKEPSGPASLRRWVGDEFFQEVSSVQFSEPLTRDDLNVVAGFGHLRSLAVANVKGLGDGLGRLAGLSNLRTLQIGVPLGNGADLTDAILAPVGRLTGLDHLSITRSEITDAGLDSLRGLTQLETLTLNFCPRVTSVGVARLLDHSPCLEHLDLPNVPVDDAMMPALGRLQRLKALNLSRTKVTDAGMAYLAGATVLETLQIGQTAVGDAGLAQLVGLTKLQRLRAGLTPITDAGLAHLGRMTSLSTLELSATKITDAGLAHLAPLQGLRSLHVMATTITDAGTPALARLSGLNLLNLTNTKVTDAGLLPLVNLKQLNGLIVTRTAVTVRGEAEFRRLLPTLTDFQRVPAARPTMSRPAPARPGADGATPAQPLRPVSAANRPDQPAQSTAGSKGTVVDSSSAAPPGGILARLKDKHRPVIVFAPSGDDDRATRQRNAWVGPLPEAGIKDRDIVVVEVIGAEATASGQTITPEEARALRLALGVADETFAVVLIGRDGTEKARWTDPVSSQEVFGRIDGMPMRQEEVERKGGH